MFSSEKHKKKESDKEVNNLQDEITRLRKLLAEKDRLNLGLATALEKARQIELSAQNLYELKIQKVLIMCKNLERRFEKLFRLYPQIQEFDDLKLAFDEFSTAVSDGFSSASSSTINSPVRTENDTIRLLLGKMSSYGQTEEPAKPAKKTAAKAESHTPRTETHTKHTDKPSHIRPILGGAAIQGDGESLADKFLESRDESNSVYAKIINNKRDDDLFPTPNESGFDLKAAVNPTDNLEDIMKAFDLDDL